MRYSRFAWSARFHRTRPTCFQRRGFARRKRPFGEQLRQCRSVDKFHCEKRSAVVLANLMVDVIYAWLGAHWHKWIARGTMTTLLILGLSGSASWLIWAVLLSFIGLRHPALADTVSPLGRPRRWLALMTAALFVLTFMPDPLRFSEATEPILRSPDAIPIDAPAPPSQPAAIPL